MAEGHQDEHGTQGQQGRAHLPADAEQGARGQLDDLLATRLASVAAATDD